MIDEATLDKWNSMAEDLEGHGVTHAYFPNVDAAIAAKVTGGVIVPDLIAEVRRLRERIKELETALSEYE